MGLIPREENREKSLKMSEKFEELNLPNAVITRIIKEAIPPGSIVSKDAKMGISRATSLFILYIGQAAMEIANDNKRKTVKESDVLKALEEADFDEMIPLIEKELEEVKNKKKQNKKPKADEANDEMGS